MVTWGATLLIFWPGLMSLDSGDQWGQMLRGRYEDAHPAFHTLVTWLITRIWLSPGMVELAQIAALAVVFALTLRELAQVGVARWAQVGIVALFALSPVSNMMVITLWKDIPCAITLLALFWMLLRVWRTEGAWLRSWRGMGLMALGLALLSLFRHNGPAVALLIVSALPMVDRMVRVKQVVVIAEMALGLVVMVRGVLYPALDVQPVPPWMARQAQIHQLGAYEAHAASLDAAEQALLERLLPLDEWRRRYVCYSVVPLLYGDPGMDKGFFDAHVDAFTDLWLRLAVRDPMTLARHQQCITSLVWRITQPADGYLATWQGDLIDNYARNLGIAPSSPVPEVRDRLMSWLRSLEHPSVIWLVWRPATYLYLALCCIGIASIRRRSLRMMGLALPVVAQSLVWMFVIIVQDFRFQYPVYLIALVSVGLLFIPGSSGSGEQRFEGGKSGASTAQAPSGAS